MVSEVNSYQKKEVLASAPDRRLKIYSDAMEWLGLNDADRAQIDLNNYLIENGLFMTRELAEVISDVSRDLALVNNEYRLHKQYGGDKYFDRAMARFMSIQVKTK